MHVRALACRHHRVFGFTEPGLTGSGCRTRRRAGTSSRMLLVPGSAIGTPAATGGRTRRPRRGGRGEHLLSPTSYRRPLEYLLLPKDPRVSILENPPNAPGGHAAPGVERASRASRASRRCGCRAPTRTCCEHRFAYSCTSSNSNTSVDKVLPGPVQQFMLCYACRVRIKRLHRSSPSTTPLNPLNRHVASSTRCRSSRHRDSCRMLGQARVPRCTTMSTMSDDVRRAQMHTCAHAQMQ